MGIETHGTIHAIFDTKQVTERFTKREFTVEIADNPKYPQIVLFQLTGDRCSQLDDLAVGEEVVVEFSLRGREWRSPSGEVKYFNTLDVWKVECVGGKQSLGGAHEPPPSYGGRDSSPDDDGIPF